MLRLITMPDPKGRYWTLTVLGTPCATGHVADEDRAVGAAMNWCRVNGYTPRGLRVAARHRRRRRRARLIRGGALTAKTHAPRFGAGV